MYIQVGGGVLYATSAECFQGCESYDDIYRYNGIRYETFIETCFARGLIDDDKEFVKAMEEVVVWGSETMLRSLCVNLITSDSVSRPEFLWESCSHILASDILNQYRIRLERPGIIINIFNSLFTVCSCVDDINALYTGYGRTGKTFVWNTLCAAVHSMGHIVLNVASSGIASLLLPGGRTAHSKFAILLNLTDESICNINKRTELAELIHQAKMIIWDEAPMTHRHCFEALDRTMRDIMRSSDPRADEKPFGGKVIVFGGDFRQILPIIAKGTRQDIVHATINSSNIWRECKVLWLTTNMRLQNFVDENDLITLTEFSNWMSSIGDGTIRDDNDGVAVLEIPNYLLITSSDYFIGSMVRAIYPDFSNHIGDVEFLQGRAILAPTLEQVNSINDYMVSMHSTDERIYLSADSIEKSEGAENMFANMHSVEFLNTIKCSGLPNHELKLKVGVPVMLIRNMDLSAGLCNGTRLVVTKLETYVIEARVLGGKNANEIVYIPRMTLSPSDSRIPFRFQRIQFPLMISYAMTINKSQGQSLTDVGVFLKKLVFTHGQLYVVVSRVMNRSG